MSFRKLVWLLPLFLLAACESAEIEYSDSNAATTEEAVADSEVVSETPGTLASPGRKVIQKADMHCRVTDVPATVAMLEKKITEAGGIVAASRIDNTTVEDKTIAYNIDSLKHVQIISTTAQMTLRVPAQLMDSVVGIIQSTAGFVASRSRSREDVTLKCLSNQMLNKPEERTATTSHALKLATDTREVMEIQRNEDARKERSVSRHIENLKLMDDVTYATLTVALSQPDRPVIQIVPDKERMMQVPFTTQCRLAMEGGWQLVSGIVLGLLSIWPLLLVLTAGLSIGYLVTRRRKKMINVNL
jgi:hypothetical protein